MFVVYRGSNRWGVLKQLIVGWVLISFTLGCVAGPPIPNYKKNVQTVREEENDSSKAEPTPIIPLPVKIGSVNFGANELLKPYLQLEFARKFNSYCQYSGRYDLFVPLKQIGKGWLFSDLRLYETDRTEVNIHLGYRRSLSADKGGGIYLGYDQRRSNLKGWQQQGTLGLEYWTGRRFMGANFYTPLSKGKIKPWKENHYLRETPLKGGDLTFGLEVGDFGFAATGYYFKGGSRKLVGTRGRVDYSPKTPVGLFGELQYDARGVRAQIGIKLRLNGHFKEVEPIGMLVHRDPDIVLDYRVVKALPKLFSTEQTFFKEFWGRDLNQFTMQELKDYENYLASQLGGNAQSTARELKQLWRKLVLTYHPDRNAAPGASERYQWVTECYKELLRIKTPPHPKQGVLIPKLSPKASLVFRKPTDEANFVDKEIKVWDNLVLAYQDSPARHLSGINAFLSLHPNFLPLVSKFYTFPPLTNLKDLWLQKRLIQHRVEIPLIFTEELWQQEPGVVVHNSALDLLRVAIDAKLDLTEVGNFLIRHYFTLDRKHQERGLVLLQQLSNAAIQKQVTKLVNWPSFASELLEYPGFLKKIKQAHNWEQTERLIAELNEEQLAKVDWLVKIKSERLAGSLFTLVLNNQVALYLTEEERKRWQTFLTEQQLEWFSRYVVYLDVKSWEEVASLGAVLQVLQIKEVTFRKMITQESEQLEDIYRGLFNYYLNQQALTEEERKLLKQFGQSPIFPMEGKIKVLLGDFRVSSNLLVYLNNYQEALPWQLSDAQGNSLYGMLEDLTLFTLPHLQNWFYSIDQGMERSVQNFWETFQSLNAGNSPLLAKGLSTFLSVQESMHFLENEINISCFGSLIHEVGEQSDFYVQFPLSCWRAPINLIKESIVSNKPQVNFKQLGRDNDFYRWAKDFPCYDKSLQLAVISEAVRRLFGYVPRFSQLFAVALGVSYKEGILLEIGTGEGKSLVIAMSALLEALSSHRVSIASSSHELTKRDNKYFRPLYLLFGLDSGEISESVGVYGSPIIYGDVYRYISDDLYDLYFRDVKGSRGFNEVHLIDEVDSLWLDNNYLDVMIGTKIPGFSSFDHVFILLREFCLELLSSFENRTDGCYLVTDKEQISTVYLTAFLEEETIETSYRLAEDCWVLSKLILTHYGQTVLANWVPLHLIPYYEHQLPYWLDNLIYSFTYRDKVEFVFVQNEQRNAGTTIEPVNPDTGLKMLGLHLGDGLHAFLALNNQVSMPSESLVSTNEAYATYFHKYRGLKGYSGTLGSRAELSFLTREYGVAIAKIPNFTTKKIQRYPVVWLAGQPAWLATIIQESNYMATIAQRAVLIIMENILLAELLYQTFLAEPTSGPSKLFLYVHGGQLDARLIDQYFTSGSILISTHLATRGTDIKLTEEVVKRGGLHLIITSVPKKIRLEKQAIGRVARQSQPGSYRVILDLHKGVGSCSYDDNVYMDSSAATKLYQCVKEELRVKEEETMVLEVAYLKKTKFYQQLGNLRILFERNLLAPFLNNLVWGAVPKDYREIGIVLEAGRIYAVNIEKVRIDLTDQLGIIRRNSLQAITACLSNPNGVVNYFDDQILRFLLINEGLAVDKTLSKVLNKQVKTALADKQTIFTLVVQDQNYKDFYQQLVRAENVEEQLVVIERIKLRYGAYLWVEAYNRTIVPFLRNQSNEDWGVWIKLFKDQNQDFSDLSLRRAFQSYTREILERIHQEAYITNPHYLTGILQQPVVEHPLVQLLNQYFFSLLTGNYNRQAWLMERSLQLDAEHYRQWLRRGEICRQSLLQVAHYNKRRDKPSIHQAKNKYLEHSLALDEKLSTELDLLKGDLLVLGIHQEGKLSELLEDYLSRVAILDQIQQHFRENHNLVARSGSNRNVVVTDEYALTDLLAKIDLAATYHNLTQANLSEEYQLVFAQRYLEELRGEGVVLWNLKEVTLKTNWLQKVLGLTAGILSIVAGWGLSSLGFHALGFSLISKGIEGSLQVIRALIMGEDFEIGRWGLHSVLGIVSNLGLYKLLSIFRYISPLQKLLQAQQLGLEEFLQNQWGTLLKGLGAGTLETVLYQVLYKANMKLFLDVKRIEKQARKLVGDLLSEHRDYLNRLLYTDYLNGNHQLEQKLLQQWMEIWLKHFNQREKWQKKITMAGKIPYLKEVVNRAQQVFAKFETTIEMINGSSEMTEELRRGLIDFEIEQGILAHRELFISFLQYSSEEIVEGELKGDFTLTVSDDCKQFISVSLAEQCYRYFEVVTEYSGQLDHLTQLGERLVGEYVRMLTELNYRTWSQYEAGLGVQVVGQPLFKVIDKLVEQHDQEKVTVVQVNQGHSQNREFSLQRIDGEEVQKGKSGVSRMSEQDVIQLVVNKQSFRVGSKNPGFLFATKQAEYNWCLSKGVRRSGVNENSLLVSDSLQKNSSLPEIKRGNSLTTPRSNYFENKVFKRKKHTKQITKHLEVPHYFQVNNLVELQNMLGKNGIVIGERPLCMGTYCFTKVDKLSQLTMKLYPHWKLYHQQIFYTDGKGGLKNLGAFRLGLGQENVDVSRYHFTTIYRGISGVDNTRLVGQFVQQLEKRQYRYRPFSTNCQWVASNFMKYALALNQTQAEAIRSVKFSND